MNTLRGLDLFDLAWALGLVAIAIGLAQWQRLGITGKLVLAAGRAILQLLVMGLGLQLVWQIDRLVVTLGAIFALMIVTAIATSNRISDRIKDLLPIVSGAMLSGLTVAVVYTIFVIIKPINWSQPAVLLACAGISLGYLLNSTAVAGERMISEIERHPGEIETQLSLGATPFQAIATYRQVAIKAALLPTIDTLMVAGLVTIPGFLAGGTIANISPINAAGYQIVMLFMAICGNTIAAVVVTGGISRRYFDPRDRLRSI
jgi:putative ABC transport system permease protein